MSAIPFIPFAVSNSTIRKSKSHLPHWSRAGAAHFVTFRLSDSIPSEALVRWEAKRREWVSLKGINLETPNWFSSLNLEQRRDYRRKFGASFEKLIDKGFGACYLQNPSNSKILSDCLHHFDGERYYLGDYVIMPNHVHVLVVPLSHSLQEISKTWKSYSARKINEQEFRTGSLWQRESFDHIVRNEQQLKRLIEYISENPSKAGLDESNVITYQAKWKNVVSKEELPEK